MIAYSLKPDGTRVERIPADGKKFTLEEMRAAIDGGYIRLVTVAKGMYMGVDEDGYMKKLPYNPRATAMLNSHEPFVGTVFIFPKKMLA
jgi:hypothetical protein